MSFKEGKEADLKRGGGRGRGTGGRASGGGRGKGDGSGGAKDAEARQNSGARGRNSGDAQQQLPPADAGTNGTAQQERPSAWGEGSIHEKHRGQHHKDDGRDGGKRGGDREPRTWRGGGGGAAAAANGGDHRREKPRSEERSAWGSAPDAYDNRKPPRTRDEHLPAGGRKGGGGGEGARAVESNYDYKYDYKPPTRGRERGHGSHRGDERDYQQQQQGGGQPQEPPPTRITDKDAPPPPPLAAPRKGGKGDRNLSDRPPPRSTPAHDQWEPTREAPPATRPDLPAKADLRRQNQNQNQGERDPSGRSIGSLRQGVPRERIVDKGPVVPQDVCLSYNVVDELVEKTITRVLDEGFWWPHDLVPGRAMQYFGWQYDEDKKLAHSVTVPVPQFLRERVLRPLQSIPATLSTFPLGVEPDHVLAMEQDWGKSDANLSFEPLQCPNAFVSDMAFVVLNNSCTFSFSSPDKDSKPIEVSVPRRTAVVFRGSSSQLNKRLIRRETDDAERTVIVAFRLLSDTAKQVRLEGHWASPNKLGWTNDKLQRHSNMIQEMKNRCNMYKLKERQEEEERIQKEEEEAKLVEMRRELEARAEATRREEAQRVEEEARRRERHEVETRQREIREAEQRERDRELDMQRQRDHELDQQRQLVERERAERDRQAQLQQQQQQQQQHPHKQQQQQQAPPQDDQRLPPPGPHGPPGAPGHPPHHAGQGPPMQQQGQARQQLGSTQPPGLRKEDGYDRIPSPPAADDEPSKPFNLFDSVGKDAAGPSTAFAPSGQRPHAPPQQQHPHPLSSQYGLSRDLFESSQPGHDRYGSVSPVAPHAPDGFSRDRPPPPQAQPQHARGEYGGEYPSHAAIKPTAPPPSHAPGPGSAPGPSNASSTVDQGYGLWTSSQYYGSGGYQGGSGAGAPSQRMMGPGSHGPPGPPGPPPPSGGQSQGPSHEGPGGLQGPFFDSLGGSQERGREFWGQQFAGLNVNAKPFQPPPEGGGSTMREAPGHGQQSHQPPGHGPLSYLGQSRPQEHSHGSSGPGQAHPQQQPQHPLSRQPYSQQGMYGQQQPPSQHMMQSSMSRPQQPSYAFQANVSNVPSNASIGSGSLSSSQNMQYMQRSGAPPPMSQQHSMSQVPPHRQGMPSTSAIPPGTGRLTEPSSGPGQGPMQGLIGSGSGAGLSQQRQQAAQQQQQQQQAAQQQQQQQPSQQQQQPPIGGGLRGYGLAPGSHPMHSSQGSQQIMPSRPAQQPPMHHQHQHPPQHQHHQHQHHQQQQQQHQQGQMPPLQQMPRQMSSPTNPPAPQSSGQPPQQSQSRMVGPLSGMSSTMGYQHSQQHQQQQPPPQQQQQQQQHPQQHQQHQHQQQHHQQHQQQHHQQPQQQHQHQQHQQQPQQLQQQQPSSAQRQAPEGPPRLSTQSVGTIGRAPPPMQSAPGASNPFSQERNSPPPSLGSQSQAPGQQGQTPGQGQASGQGLLNRCVPQPPQQQHDKDPVSPIVPQHALPQPPQQQQQQRTLPP